MVGAGVGATVRIGPAERVEPRQRVGMVSEVVLSISEGGRRGDSIYQYIILTIVYNIGFLCYYLSVAHCTSDCLTVRQTD